jgi:pSer/pThr/pTyr-binding forkhead associated (FHA) protein
MRLRLTGPDNQRLEFEIPQHGLTVGRGPRNHVDLDDRTVSRRQIRVSLNVDGRVILEDLSSRYGTFLNGRRLRSPVAIQVDDGFQFGSWFGDIVDESEVTGTRRSTREIRAVKPEDMQPSKSTTRKTRTETLPAADGRSRVLYWVAVAALSVLILSLLALLLQTQT